MEREKKDGAGRMAVRRSMAKAVEGEWKSVGGGIGMHSLQLTVAVMYRYGEVGRAMVLPQILIR